MSRSLKVYETVRDEECVSLERIWLPGETAIYGILIDIELLERLSRDPLS